MNCGEWREQYTRGRCSRQLDAADGQGLALAYVLHAVPFPFCAPYALRQLALAAAGGWHQVPPTRALERGEDRPAA